MLAIGRRHMRVDRQQRDRWRLSSKRVLWAAGIAIALVVLIRIGYAFHWTGFGQLKVGEVVQPAKTFWDWLDLLVVPVVLALGGYLFTRSENLRTQKIADLQRQDDMLRAYLDGMSQLLTDKERPLGKAQMGDDLSTVARAQTLTVLARLDGERKRSVLHFLFESELIYKYHSRLNESGLIESQHPIVSLSQADLSGAELSGATLIGAYLGEADLSGADLSWASLFKAVLGGANLSKANLSEAWLDNAVLPGANLSGANLSDAGLVEAILGGANLTRSDLRGANLTRANLSGVSPFGDDIVGANLSGADLRDVDLSGADLRDADLSGADLRDADLSGATGVLEEELTQQILSLEGATMPNGQNYEDWRKDNEGCEEDRENDDPL
jgi:uncharacterized protein YjbI with pentapeptide repeats